MEIRAAADEIIACSPYPSAVIQKLKELRDNFIKPVSRPTKPRVIVNNASEAKAFAQSWEEYEKQVEVYNAYKAQQDAVDFLIDEIIVAYIKESAGLERVPEKYQDKVYQFAYAEGHAYGYDCVFNTLEKIIQTIFE